MESTLVITEDGSHSLFNKTLNEHYHSTHGAIQESNHVFIDAGLHFINNNNKQGNSINILEVGLGTGLNAFLTLLEAQKNAIKIAYTAVEAFPISISLADQLNYVEQLHEQKNQAHFDNIHSCEWGNSIKFSDHFNFMKIKDTLQTVNLTTLFDLIYFDAFAPDVQPDMWTEEVFTKLYNATSINGALVTYCAKGVVKRTLKKVGYTVESIPGPPGKREMVRAIKQ